MGKTKGQNGLKGHIIVSCVQTHRSGAVHSTGRVKGHFRMKGSVSLSGKEGQREENGHVWKIVNSRLENMWHNTDRK